MPSNPAKKVQKNRAKCIELPIQNRLVEQAVHTKPTTYRGIVATPAST